MHYYKTKVRSISVTIFIALLLVTIANISCNKYLEKKPRENLAVPSTLNDLQAVLDNQIANSHSLEFLEFVADNFYLTTPSWNSLNQDLRKSYTWDSDAKITIESFAAWNKPYKAAYEANFVLDNLEKINIREFERSQANSIKGSALFIRSFMFHQLAQLYCKPFSSSAASDPGIVLRTTSEIEAPVSRSTVKQAYDLVLSDLKLAAELLPEDNLYSTRPNKIAAYGLLARIFLSMSDYENAEINASAALNLKSALLDYGALSSSGNLVIPVNPLTNSEILYLSANTFPAFSPSYAPIVDSTLYQSYETDDARKSVFFGLNQNLPFWRGSYAANGTGWSIFDGIATDEIYLIRAESRARTGKVSGAMEDLNALLIKRWKTGTYVPRTANNKEEALAIILAERRKELAFRGLRWSDLRRFNQEGAAITLRRVVNGQQFELPPNDLRWVLLIPEIEINRSGIEQNPR